MKLTFVWKIRLDTPPEQLWRYIADTNRLNHYAGLPEFRFQYIPEADGGSRQTGETRHLGWRLRWDEHPFQWVEGRYYEVVRTYHNGPIRDFHTAVTLTPENGGTLLQQTITCKPRWFFAAPAIQWEIGVSSRRRFMAAYRKIEGFLGGKSEAPFVPVPRVATSPGRLEAVRQRLSNAAGRQWLPRLIEAVESLPDEEVDAMQPFVFADRWNGDRRAVLKLFLHASQAGLLDLSWDIICPGCRGTSERHATLRKLKAQAHCPACNIRYDADFAESVEVRFHPNASIRPVQIARYCSGGPMNAPHVAAQQRIGAGESRTIEMRLSPWTYQIRSLKLANPVILRTSAAATASSAIVRIEGSAMAPAALDLTPDVSLTFQNNGTRDVVLMIERMGGREQAATAAMVIAMDEFRTLFSAEVLSPDTPISVGSIALMFTDLKSSTQMYEEIGDAPAYGLVQRHFDLLRETVARHDGTVVKTIGDAVMAAFVDPAKAVAAAFEMHRAIADDNQAPGRRELSLKIGIHQGPCIAVNMNELLDYFGTAVNLAARVQKESVGGDIVITEPIWNDPHVRELLANRNCAVETRTCEIRGLTGKQQVFRLS